MKICWDNLNKLKYKNGNWYYRRQKYVYMNNCKWCNDSYLSRSDNKGEFCSKSCRSKHFQTGKIPSVETRIKMSESQKKRHIGVVQRNLPLFDTFAHQIDWVEEVRYIFEGGIKLLQVKCKKCKKWFMPTRDAVKYRSRALNKEKHGQCYLYCSDVCKYNCEIYGQSKYPRGFKKSHEYTNGELYIWRKEVLQRVNYECEYCGKKATDAHHIKPKKLEPFFALDPDYGVACCEECHYKYGHKDECSTGSLAQEVCV